MSRILFINYRRAYNITICFILIIVRLVSAELPLGWDCFGIPNTDPCDPQSRSRGSGIFNFGLDQKTSKSRVSRSVSTRNFGDMKTSKTSGFFRSGILSGFFLSSGGDYFCEIGYPDEKQILAMCIIF